MTTNDPADATAPKSGTDPDTESDPAESDREGADWASEGGATPEGPATHAPGQ